jgi:hypothetical protein
MRLGLNYDDYGEDGLHGNAEEYGIDDEGEEYEINGEEYGEDSDDNDDKPDALGKRTRNDDDSDQGNNKK